MTTARDLADALTADQIEALIADAIGDRDFKAVEALLAVLVLKDPRRATEVWDTIQVGLVLAKLGHSEGTA